VAWLISAANEIFRDSVQHSMSHGKLWSLTGTWRRNLSLEGDSDFRPYLFHWTYV